MIDKCIIHCSDSSHGRGDNAKTIHKWHKQNGWDGIGYHYVIDEIGNIQNGRPDYWQGAGVRGHNQDAIHICLIGIDYFNFLQKLALQALVRRMARRYKGIKFYGHYHFDDNKTCPNFDVDYFMSTGEFKAVKDD